MADISGRVVIPFYPTRDLEHHRQILLDCLKSLEEYSWKVIVVCPPDLERAIPPTAELQRAPLGSEPETPLPRGWLTAVRRISGCDDVMILDHTRALNPEAVGHGFRALQESGAEAALGVLEAEDHPCQCNILCDVVVSHPFIPVDEKAAEARAACAELFEASVVITCPFTFPWRDWIADETGDGKIYEVLPEIHSLRPVRKETTWGRHCDTILLWRESWTLARQICFDLAETVAVPLLETSAALGVTIRKDNGKWVVEADGSFVQVFPLGNSSGAGFGDDWLSLHRLTRVEGGAPTVCVPPMRSFFLLNLLKEAVLPHADMEWPYIPHVPVWETSFLTSERTSRGESIYGRQAFPTAFEFNGALLGMSARALNEPMGALKRQDFTLFPVETVPPLIPEPWQGEAYSDSRALGPSPLPVQGLEDGESCTRSIPPDWEYTNGIGPARVEFRFWAARTLFEITGTDLRTLPLQAFAILEEKAKDAVQKERKSEKKSSIRSDGAGQGLGNRLTDVRNHEVPAEWLLQQAQTRHEEQDFEKTTRALDRLYERYPGIGNHYAAVAVDKYISCLRYDRALALFERERRLGWMTSLNTIHYAEALAACGQMSKAEQIITSAYAANSSLCDGYARIGFVAYCWTEYNPAKALEYIVQDEGMGRLDHSHTSLSRKGRLLAGLGRLEEALKTIQEAYKTYGQAPGGGFAGVGWGYHVVLNHNPHKTFPFFEMDRRYRSRHFYAQFLGALAYCGNLEKAENLFAAEYEKNKYLKGYYSLIGLLHWLRYRDMDVLRRCLLEDYYSGSMNLRLQIILLLMIRNHGWVDGSIEDALHAEVQDAFCLGWKLALSFLISNGFDTQAIQSLIPDFFSIQQEKSKLPNYFRLNEGRDELCA